MRCFWRVLQSTQAYPMFGNTQNPYALAATLDWYMKDSRYVSTIYAISLYAIICVYVIVKSNLR